MHTVFRFQILLSNRDNFQKTMGTLTGTITLGQNGHENNEELVNALSRGSELKPHHWMKFRVISRTLSLHVCTHTFNTGTYKPNVLT